MASQSETSKRKCIRWSDQMDEVLVETLMEEATKGGKKPDNGWKSESLTRVVVEVERKTRQIITHDNIKARLKTMKKEYTAARQALSQSGFNINPLTHCLSADEDAWARYVQAHPDAAGLRDRPLKFYDSWQVIIGNEQANGDRAVEADDFPPPPPPPPSQGDHVGDNVSINDDVDAHSTQKDTVSKKVKTHPDTVPTQRRKRLHAFEDGISEGVIGIVEAANRIAATFEGPNWERINAALEAIPELEETAAYQAAELFSKDPWMAQYFLSLSEGKRLGWLKMKLRI